MKKPLMIMNCDSGAYCKSVAIVNRESARGHAAQNILDGGLGAQHHVRRDARGSAALRADGRDAPSSSPMQQSETGVPTVGPTMKTAADKIPRPQM